MVAGRIERWAGSEWCPNSALLPLLHGPVRHNTFTAVRADECFDCRQSRERVQRVAMGTACATGLSRCHLHHDRGGEFHGHSPDDGTAFVAGYVSLIAAHVDNEAAAAIRSCSHLVGDNQKALFIAGHNLIISRSPEHTRLPALHRNSGLRARPGGCSSERGRATANVGAARPACAVTAVQGKGPQSLSGK